MADKKKDTDKVPNPVAPLSGKLPDPPAGCEWDTVEISKWDFAILVAKDLTGIESLCKGDADLAARLFNRALRIDVPAKLEGRDRMKGAKDKREMARVLQQEVLAFDLTAIRPRAARRPREVAVSDLTGGMDEKTRKLLEERLRAAGLKIT